MNILLALVLLQVLIIIHELGHYLFARAFGMRTPRFSVGFGPRLFGFRHGETEFVLSAIPLGGYVQIDGMSTADEVAKDDPAAYFSKPMWQRALVVGMGPVFNLALAWLAFVFMFAVGYDKPVQGAAVIGVARAGYPAAEAGFKAGDRIVRIGEHDITSFEDVPPSIAGTTSTVDVVYERAGETHTVSLNPEYRPEPTLMRRLFNLDKPQRVLGIEAQSEHVAGEGIGAALVLGTGATAEKTKSTLQAFGSLFSGKQKGRLTGLPGILKLIGGSIDRGIGAVFALLGVLSINLFLFNLFPVPALDGGRLIFLGVEAVRRKPVDAKVENVVHTAGFLLLFSLIIFVSVRDLFV
jgi:regulator of sigma E protease